VDDLKIYCLFRFKNDPLPDLVNINEHICIPFWFWSDEAAEPRLTQFSRKGEDPSPYHFLRGFTGLFGIPPAAAQENESDGESFQRVMPGRPDLSLEEELLLSRYESALAALRQIEPEDREVTSLTAPGYIPDELTVLRVEAELQEASRRSASRIQAALEETEKERGPIQSQIVLTEHEALEAGELFLGAGYTEIAPGVAYRSADGRRQFRIDSSSLQGRHRPHVPHVHFEMIDPSTGRPLTSDHVVVKR
jgi:hypothetical protein